MNEYAKSFKKNILACAENNLKWLTNVEHICNCFTLSNISIRKEYEYLPNLVYVK
jgi:hypothetical protein